MLMTKPKGQPVILIREMQGKGKESQQSLLYHHQSGDSPPLKRFNTLKTFSVSLFSLVLSLVMLGLRLLDSLGRDDFRIFAIWHNLPFRRVTVHCHRCPPVDDESPSCRRPFPCVRHNAPINRWTSGQGSGRISDKCLKTWEVMLTTLVVSHPIR